MGIISGTKKVIKPLVNVTGWMNLRDIKKSTSDLGSHVKQLFTPKKATRKETFEQAMERLNLTEEDLKQRHIEFRRLLFVLLLTALGVLSYTGYLWTHGHIKGALVASVLLLIVLTQAFRHHFWMFQIKQRKLGCTIGEWFYYGLLGRHP